MGILGNWVDNKVVEYYDDCNCSSCDGYRAAIEAKKNTPEAREKARDKELVTTYAREARRYAQTLVLKRRIARRFRALCDQADTYEQSMSELASDITANNRLR